MTKAELIDQIHDNKAIADADVAKKNVAAIVELTFELIAEALKKDARFSYPGFGTFNKKERKERTGINPKTKEQIKIPATTTVTFKPASRFKDELKGSKKKAPAKKK
jgi:DNA-binding protein HU-beta